MYLDLEHESRTNGEFQHRLRQLIGETEYWYGLSQRDPSQLTHYREALFAMLRFCSFNTVFLTPHFFCF
jgi:hypothetical protein